MALAANPVPFPDLVVFRYLSNPPSLDRQLQRDSLDSTRHLNMVRYQEARGKPKSQKRIDSFQKAYRIRMSTAQLMALSQELARRG